MRSRSIVVAPLVDARWGVGYQGSLTGRFFQERAWGAGPTPPQGDRKGTPLPRPGAASVGEELPLPPKKLDVSTRQRRQ